MQGHAQEILEILTADSRTSPAIIAKMLGISEAAAAEEIKRLESEKILLKYTTIVNEEKTEAETTVHALIEVKVTPQVECGYDALASQISKYDEVRSCYLMSGTYDFIVQIDGTSLRQVALFVAEKLAVIDGVVSTSTHFLLRKYKDNQVIMPVETIDRRQVVFK